MSSPRLIFKYVVADVCKVYRREFFGPEYLLTYVEKPHKTKDFIIFIAFITTERLLQDRISGITTTRLKFKEVINEYAESPRKTQFKFVLCCFCALNIIIKLGKHHHIHSMQKRICGNDMCPDEVCGSHYLAEIMHFVLCYALV